eukprot:8156856-Ditylum_brightwellii.AAC.1
METSTPVVIVPPLMTQPSGGEGDRNNDADKSSQSVPPFSDEEGKNTDMNEAEINGGRKDDDN